ncbi:RING-type E3 ubiquitin transferase [Balamuthia mandrillaris]
MEDVQHMLELLRSGAMGFNLSGDGGNPPASQLSISELPDVVIEDKHVHRGLDCTVCGNPFKQKEDAKQMPCKHIFHDMCLLPWLSRVTILSFAACFFLLPLPSFFLPSCYCYCCSSSAGAAAGAGAAAAASAFFFFFFFFSSFLTSSHLASSFIQPNENNRGTHAQHVDTNYQPWMKTTKRGREYNERHKNEDNNPQQLKTMKKSITTIGGTNKTAILHTFLPCTCKQREEKTVG